MELADLTAHAKVIPGFWPRWAPLWPESCVAVPATLVFWPWLLAAGPPPGKRKNARRSTIVVI